MGQHCLQQSYAIEIFSYDDILHGGEHCRDVVGIRRTRDMCIDLLVSLLILLFELSLDPFRGGFVCVVA